VDRGK
jgi:hypothetical protein